MRDGKEATSLMISSIQHFVFCRRQWGLIHLEQQWQENFLTTDGSIFHEKAHQGLSFEKRKDCIISRGMPVSSQSLGISGVCDIVEFQKNPEGISLIGRTGLYSVSPVEYKRGKPKVSPADRYQLVAQALCLEEMLCCNISLGYLYYGETRHRVAVEIDEDIRKQVASIIQEMHVHYNRGHTPQVKKSRNCASCSLKDLCLPQLYNTPSAQSYIKDLVSGGSL